MVDETPCTGKWTEWFNYDDASGYGDFETTELINSQSPAAICPKPTGLSVKTSDNKPPVGLKLHLSKNFGVACVNDLNNCPDLQVRFCCPTDSRTHILLVIPGLKARGDDPQIQTC